MPKKLEIEKPKFETTLKNQFANQTTKTHPFPYDMRVYRWTMPDVRVNPEKVELEINSAMNQSAGTYPYWFADAEGITLILAVPAQTYKIETFQKASVIMNSLKAFEEREAIQKAQSTSDDLNKESMQLIDKIISRLYDKGLVIAEKVSKP